MFSDIRRRAKKTGQSPGTPHYTGRHSVIPEITIVHFSEEQFYEEKGRDLAVLLNKIQQPGVTWIHVDGLSDTKVVEEIGKQYHLHPLTVEDILNVDQRPKVEEFEHYIYLTIKTLQWRPRRHTFSIGQLSLVLGENFVLSFRETESNMFDNILERLRSTAQQRLRQHGSDYLLYRLIDTVVDQYFLVLEKVGEQIETVEEKIITSSDTQRPKLFYQLKRRMLILRKAIWPVREVISHISQVEEKFITRFTHTYLRDIYDHVVQAIDTIETFRDIIASILDVYLSSMTNRMNEIMKILTIISTIFIPMTFLASLYGMNFQNIPELHNPYGYYIVLVMMLAIAISMLIYFRRKKWI